MSFVNITLLQFLLNFQGCQRATNLPPLPPIKVPSALLPNAKPGISISNCRGFGIFQIPTSTKSSWPAIVSVSPH